MKPHGGSLTGGGPTDTFHAQSWNRIAAGGQVAQVVEQRPEKPCVDGSNPSLATFPTALSREAVGFLFLLVFASPPQRLHCGLLSWGRDNTHPRPRHHHATPAVLWKCEPALVHARRLWKSKRPVERTPPRLQGFPQRRIHGRKGVRNGGAGRLHGLHGYRKRVPCPVRPRQRLLGVGPHSCKNLRGLGLCMALRDAGAKVGKLGPQNVLSVPRAVHPPVEGPLCPRLGPRCLGSTRRSSGAVDIFPHRAHEASMFACQPIAGKAPLRVLVAEILVGKHVLIVMAGNAAEDRVGLQGGPAPSRARPVGQRGNESSNLRPPVSCLGVFVGLGRPERRGCRGCVGGRRLGRRSDLVCHVAATPGNKQQCEADLNCASARRGRDKNWHVNRGRKNWWGSVVPHVRRDSCAPRPAVCAPQLGPATRYRGEQESCRASCARLRGATETNTTDDNGIFARTPRRVHTAGSVRARL